MCLDDKLITGRPHGGLEYYGENPSHKEQTLLNISLGLEIKCNNAISLFVCVTPYNVDSVYLPYKCDMFYDDYIFFLNEITLYCAL